MRDIGPEGDLIEQRRRLGAVERRLAESERALRRAEATIAMLNDRLAWSEAELAALAAPMADPGCRQRDAALEHGTMAAVRLDGGSASGL